MSIALTQPIIIESTRLGVQLSSIHAHSAAGRLRNGHAFMTPTRRMLTTTDLPAFPAMLATIDMRLKGNASMGTTSRFGAEGEALVYAQYAFG